MLQVEFLSDDGSIRQMQAPDESILGKAVGCEVRLAGWRIGREHARLSRTPGGILLEDLGTFAGLAVDGRRIDGQYGPLKPHEVIEIGPYRLRVSDPVVSPPVQAAHPASRSSTRQYRNLRASEEIRASRLVAERAQVEILASAADTADAADVPRHGYALVVTPEPGRQDLEFTWRKQIHAALLETMDLRRHDTLGMSDLQLRQETRRLIDDILLRMADQIPTELDVILLGRQVLDEAIGLGPLEALLADESVTEIMVNRFDEIYVERGGRLQRHAMSFTGERAVLGVIERIVAPLGRRIDESSPMVDARLKDGSRVNAIIAPLALKGACLTIRKFSRKKLAVADLVEFEAINGEMALFLELCVTARKNIIVSGGTGSGKTTLLNILSNFIPSGERVVTVEDAAELRLHHAHMISLEARPPNVEGKGGVSIRELVRNTLRMRPDRIVVGECRGAEALDMLQAMNTGHEGSLTTLHANTARDALARLETMVLMAGMDLPLQAIREQVASAVHVIVQQTRFSCGARKVTGITEITGMESGRIQIQELFRFVHLGHGPDGRVKGYFTGCNMVPGFYEELRATGAILDMRLFEPHQPGPDTAQHHACDDTGDDDGNHRNRHSGSAGNGNGDLGGNGRNLQEDAA